MTLPSSRTPSPSPPSSLLEPSSHSSPVSVTTLPETTRPRLTQIRFSQRESARSEFCQIDEPETGEVDDVFPSGIAPKLPRNLSAPYGLYRFSNSSTALNRRVASSTTSISNFRRPYPSTKLSKPIEKPWLKYPDRAQKWGQWVFWGLAMLGVLGGAAICYLGVNSVPSPGKLCLIMDDDFSTGIDPAYWTHEVQLDGFGNDEFDWTTTSTNNSFVEDNTLYIVPTLTADAFGANAITDGFTLNLTAEGICTSDNVTKCAVVSNSSTGTLINPVQSARLITRDKISIRYGKVEVEARMPKGDWLWPAIWMLPVNESYGVWPRSGEIDIAESRGNNASYGQLGIDRVQSSLHWGPMSSLDSYWRTFGIRDSRRRDYHLDFHKYTLEWTDKYMWLYLDNRVYSTFYLDLNQAFWTRGDYPEYYQNGTQMEKLNNPWYSSTSKAAPFDQSFFLILNVAVGGTNGYFPDNLGGKPWLDSSLTAMSDFWESKDKWYATWPVDPKERGMAVKSVKMWQQC